MAAGCDDDGASDGTTAPPSADRLRYASATAELVGHAGGGAFADCLGLAMVTEVVSGRLEDAGMTVEEFTEDHARRREVAALSQDDVESIVGAVDDCGDVVDEAIIAMDDPASASARCVEEHYDDRDLAEYFVVSFFGGRPSSALLEATDRLDACESSG